MDLPQSVWRYIYSTNIKTSFRSSIWQVSHAFLSPAFQTEGSFLGMIWQSRCCHTGQNMPFLCMVQVFPHQRSVWDLASSRHLFMSLRTQESADVAQAYIVNSVSQKWKPPYPLRHNYWHQITCNHPSLPPTSYKQFINILFAFQNWISSDVVRKKARGTETSPVWSTPILLSFPQNVRLHICFNFGFNIYFSYRFLF